MKIVVNKYLTTDPRDAQITELLKLAKEQNELLKDYASQLETAKQQREQALQIARDATALLDRPLPSFPKLNLN